MKEIKLKDRLHEVVFGMIFSIVIYSTFMTQQLTNTYDGLWRQSYSRAGDWEISLGRWLLYEVDLIHKGLHLDPMTSIMTLAAYVLGFVLILDLFNVKSKVISYISMALFLSSTLVSIVLSYRMTSFAYGLSFLVSATAIYLLNKIKSANISIVAAAVCICGSMSLYQAYFEVFCLVALFYLIYQIMISKINMKQFTSYLIDLAESTVIGIILYAFTMSVSLKRKHITLSSYHGASSAGSTDTLKSIPVSVIKAYKEFFGYYFDPKGRGFYINAFQDLKLLWFAFAIALTVIIFAGVKIFKECEKVQFILYSVTIILMPLASNVVLIMAPQADFSLQITVGLAIFLPMVVMLMDNLQNINKYVTGVALAILMLIVGGNTLQVQLDQNAMLEGRNACTTMAYQIIDDLKDQNMLDSELFFVGSMADNPKFFKSELFDKANNYARVGCFALNGNCMRQSYYGLFDRLLGAELRFKHVDYEELAYAEDIAAMPSYPYDGYIKNRDGVVIVKIN